MARRFVALDRDGTLIAERHYLTDPAGVEILPGVIDGLQTLRSLDLGLIVVTNQSVIGRGLLDEAGLAQIHERVEHLLGAAGVRVDGWYVCPHAPDERCLCRKPRRGLIDRAARQLDFDPRDGFVIGDKPCDIHLGREVGATTLLVRTGYGRQVENSGTANPHYIVDGIREAAEIMARLLSAHA